MNLLSVEFGYRVVKVKYDVTLQVEGRNTASGFWIDFFIVKE